MDLRESLGEAILLRLALDAVQSFDPALLAPKGSGPEHPRPKMMLTLLAYCYAARIYGSREIERAALREPDVNYICAHSVPSWQAIRQFRRNYRPLLEHCLTYVLRKAWLLQAEPTEPADRKDDWGTPGSQDKLAEDARAKIDVAILMDREAY